MLTIDVISLMWNTNSNMLPIHIVLSTYTERVDTSTIIKTRLPIMY